MTFDAEIERLEKEIEKEEGYLSNYETGGEDWKIICCDIGKLQEKLSQTKLLANSEEVINMKVEIEELKKLVDMAEIKGRKDYAKMVNDAIDECKIIKIQGHLVRPDAIWKKELKSKLAGKK